MNDLKQIVIRSASNNDNLERIAELIYKTDPYIYPYWFENIDNCKKMLPVLMKQDGFIFNLKNIDVAVEKDSNEILGIICSYKNSDNLNFDYSKLEQYNDRYCFTINNYLRKVISEVKKADYIYISNVCIHDNARGLGIAGKLINYVKEKYKKQLFSYIQLDVITNNNSAINAYRKNKFNEVGEKFLGFAAPNQEKPTVVSMRSKL